MCAARVAKARSCAMYASGARGVTPRAAGTKAASQGISQRVGSPGTGGASRRSHVPLHRDAAPDPPTAPAGRRLARRGQVHGSRGTQASSSGTTCTVSHGDGSAAAAGKLSTRARRASVGTWRRAKKGCTAAPCASVPRTARCTGSAGLGGGAGFGATSCPHAASSEMDDCARCRAARSCHELRTPARTGRARARASPRILDVDASPAAPEKMGNTRSGSGAMVGRREASSAARRASASLTSSTFSRTSTRRILPNYSRLLATRITCWSAQRPPARQRNVRAGSSAAPAAQ